MPCIGASRGSRHHVVIKRRAFSAAWVMLDRMRDRLRASLPGQAAPSLFNQKLAASWQSPKGFRIPVHPVAAFNGRADRATPNDWIRDAVILGRSLCDPSNVYMGSKARFLDQESLV